MAADELVEHDAFERLIVLGEDEVAEALAHRRLNRRQLAIDVRVVEVEMGDGPDQRRAVRRRERDTGSLERGEHVARPGFVPQPSDEQQQLIERIVALYRNAGTQANNRKEMLGALPAPAEQVDDCLAYLFSRGDLVRLPDEMIFHRDAYAAALAALREHFATRPTLTLAEFRDRIGSARKQTQALLEHFDALKYTMRRGDVRVAWQLPKNSETRDE